MAANLYNLIIKGCLISYEGNPTPSFRNKLSIIASRFTTLKGFKEATVDRLNTLRSEEGELFFRPLTRKESCAVKSFQDEIELNRSIVQNFIKLLTKEFLCKQLSMLSNISIDTFNANPILCTALNLKTPEEFVRYNAYQAIGRSIVTSMGFLVQDLLLYSNEFIFDGKDYSEGKNTKFDLEGVS